MERETAALDRWEGGLRPQVGLALALDKVEGGELLPEEPRHRARHERGVEQKEDLPPGRRILRIALQSPRLLSRARIRPGRGMHARAMREDGTNREVHGDPEEDCSK